MKQNQREEEAETALENLTYHPRQTLTLQDLLLDTKI